jgi:hypothetical protein
MRSFQWYQVCKGGEGANDMGDKRGTFKESYCESPCYDIIYELTFVITLLGNIFFCHALLYRHLHLSLLTQNNIKIF